MNRLREQNTSTLNDLFEKKLTKNQKKSIFLGKKMKNSDYLETEGEAGGVHPLIR